MPGEGRGGSREANAEGQRKRCTGGRGGREQIDGEGREMSIHF